MHDVSLGSYEISNGLKLIRKDYRVNIEGRTFLTGRSGMGKSTIMRAAAIQTIQAGKGMLFTDFHGDVADDLLGYIPRWRFERGDVVYINPLEDMVPSLNTLFWETEEERELKCDSLISIFKGLFKAWGDETERILTAGLQAITECQPNPTLAHLYLFVARTAYRRRLEKKSKNFIVKDFADQYDNDDKAEGLRPSERMAKFSPPLNKADAFIRRTMLGLLAQEKRTNWRQFIDEGKIIICNLSKGKLGADNASLIACLIISEIWSAALQRDMGDEENIPPDFYMFVDEAHNAFHGINLDSFLSESRKFRIFPFFGIQYISQIPDIQAAFGNYSTWLSGRLGGTDAEMLAKEFADPDLERDLISLPKYHFIGYSDNRDNMPEISPMITARKKVKKLGDEPPRGAVKADSLARYASSKKSVVEKAMKFLAA